MIIAVTGMPGAGKSRFLVVRAVQAMREGRPVFANFPIKGAFRIKLSDLRDYVFPAGALVLVDEGGRWFNAKDWASLPSEVFDTFTLHRHLQIDLILAMNAIGYIDINIRRVTELTYWAENKKLSPFFVYRGYYDLENSSGNMNREEDVKVFHRKWHKANNYYDTYAMSAAFANRPQMPQIKYGPKPISKLSLYKRYARFKFYKKVIMPCKNYFKDNYGV